MPKKIEPLTPVELNRKIEKLKQAGTQGLIAVGGVPGLHLCCCVLKIDNRQEVVRAEN